jgi:ABC-type Fe3+/spermidine/putrescine transport system ATPase subunit
MSDRIAVMNGGRIEQVDVPARIYEQPATRFVADFIGESNMIPLAAATPGADGRLLSPVGPLRILDGNAAAARQQPAGLVVRPEKLRFAADEAGLDNVLAGAVTEIVYAGDATKYRVRVTDDLVLIVKRQNRSGLRSYQPGDAVEVGWRVEDGSIV